jgi:hypothetical protein
MTTFWCGPPLPLFDDDRAAEIAAAGFTVVGPPCEGEITVALNRAALDVAARHGIRLLVADGRFNAAAAEHAGWEEGVSVAVADYKGHPGLAGYFVFDEPVAGQFASVAAIVTRLRALDPGTLAYVNLLADYVAGEAGTGAYREYVERFLDTIRPALLSYDYYALLNGRDRSTFISSLALMREVALERDVPFMLIVQAMPHGPYRDPTEAELAWQAFHALAYGARGLSYFAYWTPVNVEYQDVMKFRHGLIEDGKPTRHYDEATRLNREVRMMAAQLERFRSIAVGDSRGVVAPALPLGPIQAIEGGLITAGLFADADGNRIVLLVNRDYRNAVEARLRLGPGESPPQRFDAETGLWRDTSGTTIPLPAGGAELVRWGK